jgi:hypothetical protein
MGAHIIFTWFAHPWMSAYLEFEKGGWAESIPLYIWSLYIGPMYVLFIILLPLSKHHLSLSPISGTSFL